MLWIDKWNKCEQWKLNLYKKTFTNALSLFLADEWIKLQQYYKLVPILAIWCSTNLWSLFLFKVRKIQINIKWNCLAETSFFRLSYNVILSYCLSTLPVGINLSIFCSIQKVCRLDNIFSRKRQYTICTYKTFSCKHYLLNFHFDK